MQKNKDIADFEEKINIYIDQESYKKLISDGQSFNILDKHKKVNVNRMINLIISNYLSEYTESLNKSISNTFEILKSEGIENNTATILARKIIWKNDSSNYEYGSRSKDKTLPVRINNSNHVIIEENYYDLQQSISKSNYIRNLLYSYLSLSPFEREKILYKKEIDRIQIAISNELMIRYENKENGNRVELSPYKLCPSTQENRNYLVGRTKNHILTIRLSNLSHVILLKEKAYFGDDFGTYFELMKKNGVQFYIDKVNITKIRMSENAIRVFNRKEFDRPVPKEIEPYPDGTAVYAFDCSEFQLKAYFEPFADSIEYLG